MAHVPARPSPPPLPPEATRPQRAHARLGVRMSAEVRTDQTTFTAATRDLSEGGAGLEIDRPLPEGEAVAIGFFLVIDDVEEERMPPLWVKARVVWTAEVAEHQYTAGVRFEVITDDQRVWLQQVLQQLQTRVTRSPQS